MTPEGKRHVFLVDDNLLFHAMVTDLCAEIGAHVTTAADAPEAFQAIQRSAPTLDVLLIDLVLPSQNGMDLLAHLRNQQASAALPAVLLTGATIDDSLVEDAKRLKAGLLDKSNVSTNLNPLLTNLFQRLSQSGR